MFDIQSVTIWFRQQNGKLNIEVRCPVCQSRPEAAKGAHDKEHLVYMLNCPKCDKTLIEYSSPEELSTDLSKIVENGDSDAAYSDYYGSRYWNFSQQTAENAGG